MGAGKQFVNKGRANGKLLFPEAESALPRSLFASAPRIHIARASAFERRPIFLCVTGQVIWLVSHSTKRIFFKAGRRAVMSSSSSAV